MSDRPGWQTAPLHCNKCEHEWTGYTPTYVPVETWVAHVKTLHCPSCGARSRSIGFRTNAGAAIAPQTVAR